MSRTRVVRNGFEVLKGGKRVAYVEDNNEVTKKNNENKLKDTFNYVSKMYHGLLTSNLSDDEQFIKFSEKVFETLVADKAKESVEHCTWDLPPLPQEPPGNKKTTLPILDVDAKTKQNEIEDCPVLIERVGSPLFSSYGHKPENPVALYERMGKPTLKKIAKMEIDEDTKEILRTVRRNKGKMPEINQEEANANSKALEDIKSLFTLNTHNEIAKENNAKTPKKFIRSNAETPKKPNLDPKWLSKIKSNDEKKSAGKSSKKTVTKKKISKKKSSKKSEMTSGRRSYLKSKRVAHSVVKKKTKKKIKLK